MLPSTAYIIIWKSHYDPTFIWYVADAESVWSWWVMVESSAECR